jgi:hypothetical protein
MFHLLIILPHSGIGNSPCEESESCSQLSEFGNRPVVGRLQSASFHSSIDPNYEFSVCKMDDGNPCAIETSSFVEFGQNADVVAVCPSLDLEPSIQSLKAIITILGKVIKGQCLTFLKCQKNG